MKEFYAKAAEATALTQLQQRGPAEDAPETFSQPFKGNQDAAGGVLGMLEVIQSDFARLETETTSSESTSQREFDQFMAEGAGTGEPACEAFVKNLRVIRGSDVVEQRECQVCIEKFQDEDKLYKLPCKHMFH